MKKKNKKTGRPSITINQDTINKAESLSAQGLTMYQIANVLGMGESTLYEKQLKFPEFSEAIKRGKDKGIATVTNALFNKAREGDNTAMIFYLKNRAGWRDRIETEHTGDGLKIDVNIQDKFSSLLEELDEFARETSQRDDGKTVISKLPSSKTIQ